MNGDNVIAAVIGAVFVGVIALLRMLLPYIAKKKPDSSKRPKLQPVKSDPGPLTADDVSGSFPVPPVPSEVLHNMQEWIDEQRERQPATQKDIQQLTDTINDFGSTLTEHMAEDSRRFDAQDVKLDRIMQTLDPEGDTAP